MSAPGSPAIRDRTVAGLTPADLLIGAELALSADWLWQHRPRPPDPAARAAANTIHRRLTRDA